MSKSEPPVLDYGGGNTPPKWVTARKFVSEFEARLAGNELEANGIRWQLFNDDIKSVLSWYGGFVSIRLAVLSDDLERANAVLASHAAAEAGDLEPAEREDPEQPLEIADDEGVSAVWRTAAVFESPRALHEAAMVLESAHLSVLLPRLVPRGEAPPGEGPRFVLRVQEDDVDRARGLLNRASEEREEDELRCPRCGAYSVHMHTYVLTNFLGMFIGQHRPKQCECLKCHYVGEPSEFGAK
jgi:ribosomal protein S27AE